MDKILCENPRFIINPLAISYIRKGNGFFRPNPVQIYVNSSMTNIQIKRIIYSISPRLENGQIDYKLPFTYDDETGVQIPIFTPVPCGKCRICLEQKSKEWEFRCSAETLTSGCTPYFVTLTYNDENKPTYGLDKKDVQDFLKRLRINIVRSGVMPQFKYFAVGEYGSKTHRPHYHLIFWNFKRNEIYPTTTSILHVIEKSWKKGFCYCVPCDRGASSYVMKYMRKECYIPKGCTPTFYLKSLGIGLDYFYEIQKYLLENPDVTKITVVDPVDHVAIESKIPKYYLEKLFPTPSKLIDKEFKNTYQYMIDLINLKETLHFRFPKSIMYSYYLPEHTCEIIQNIHPLLYGCDYIPAPNQIHERSQKPHYSFCNLMDDLNSIDHELDDIVNSLYMWINQIDTAYLYIVKNLKKIRENSLEKQFYNSPEISVENYAEFLRKKDRKSLHKEIF